MGLFANPIDLGLLEIQNAIIQHLSSAPTGVEGRVYYDTTLKQFGCYQNTTWTYLGAAVSNVVTKALNAAAANVMQVSNGADKALIDYAGGAGLVKSASNGAVSAAVAETDYVTPNGVGTLTNKTLTSPVVNTPTGIVKGDVGLGNVDNTSDTTKNAAAVALTNKTINASSNTITNLVLTMFAVNVIDTDTTLSANSDSRLATQKATKAYIDAIALSGMHIKSSVDASANPNFPASTVGDFFKISVAGKIGGASGQVVTVGDTVYCITTNAGGTDASVGSNFDIIQSNVDQATTSALGLVQLANSTQAEARSSTTLAVTPASLVNFTVKRNFTIGDGSSTDIACTHNLGTQDVVVSVRDATTNKLIYVDWTATSTSVVTINFTVAPASNAYKVNIQG